MSGITVFGQEETEKVNCIEKIELESDGRIEIVIPEKIMHSILTDFETGKKQAPKTSSHAGVGKSQGYRIQVFSDGRNQHSLESRAKARGNAIVARFPKYRGQVYTFSSSPNWYTRIGNFKSSQEAERALAELKAAFPTFSQEMRVVKSKILISK